MELWKKYEVTHERIYGIIKEKVNKRLKKEVLPVHIVLMFALHY